MKEMKIRIKIKIRRGRRGSDALPGIFRALAVAGYWRWNSA
jgi:hypothetical protein